jgi:helix-turn-helix protein
VTEPSGGNVTQQDFSKLLDERAAAEILGVVPATLCKWRATGEGPPYLKIGRRRLYDPADLKQFRDDARIARRASV